MTGRPCLCPRPVLEPGRHLVGCPHAPGDTVAPARNLLERPPVDDPQAWWCPPPSPAEREAHRTGRLLEQAARERAGAELLEQATGVELAPVDPPSLAPRRGWRLVVAWRRGWAAGVAERAGR